MTETDPRCAGSTDQGADCCAATPVARHLSDELIEHASYLAEMRVRSVLDAVEGLYGSPARQPVEEAFREARSVAHEKLWKREDELLEAKVIAAGAQATVTSLADHLVALHAELVEHVEELEGRTTPAKRPAYVLALRELADGQSTVLANVLAAAAVG